MAKKIKQPKLPKRIAGVKLPKKLRKAGGRLLAEASAPATRELMAGAIAMGAEALRRGAVVRPAAGVEPATKPVAPAAPADRLAPLVGLAASALGSWLDQAARKADAGRSAPSEPPPSRPH